MKILLDENLPVKLKKDFEMKHDVYTVRDMNWLGIKNGKLMTLIVANNFDILITSDSNMQYQQNVVSLPFTLVVLKTVENKYNNLRPLIKTLLTAIENPPLQKVIVII